MEINSANMADLFKTFNTSFTLGMQRGYRGTLPSDLVAEYIALKELAMVVPSTGSSSVHAWLDQIPGYRRWLGDRQKKKLSAGRLEVVNANFEDTIAVSRNSIEDDQYGLYAPRFEALGAEGGEEGLWLDLAIEALLANGQWIDGKAFFVGTRKYGNNTIDNLVAAELTQANFELAVKKMQSHVGPENKPLGVFPAVLLVGPTLRGKAWDIVKNSLVTAGDGKGGAVNNRTQGLCSLKVHPALTGAHANKWYVLGVKGTMKAVGVQQRRLPVLVAKDDVKDDNTFFNNEFIYGADARGEGFLTLPHLAVAGNP